MKREEAIKLLNDIHSQCCDTANILCTLDADKRCDALQMAITALQNQPVWIPVSERLPEKYWSYLVAWKPCNMSEEYVVKRSGVPHFYEILEYDPDDESGWIESIEQATGEYEILAWMPLPEPYRESEEEDGEV